MGLISLLNKFVGEELAAWYSYWIMSQLAKGKAYKALSKVFEDHAKEELEHAQELITWMQANNIDVYFDLTHLISLAKGGAAIPLFSDGVNTSKAIEAAIKSERHAIQGYREGYQEVKDSYPDLAQRLMEISLDEENHLNDDIDLAYQIGINKDSDKLDVLIGTGLTGKANFSGANINKKFSIIVSRLNNFSLFKWEKERRDELLKYGHHGLADPKLDTGYKYPNNIPDRNWIHKVGILDLTTGKLSYNNENVKDGNTLVEFYKNLRTDNYFAVISERLPNSAIGTITSFRSPKGRILFDALYDDYYFGEFISEAIPKYGNKIEYYVYA